MLFQVESILSPYKVQLHRRRVFIFPFSLIYFCTHPLIEFLRLLLLPLCILPCLSLLYSRRPFKKSSIHVT